MGLMYTQSRSSVQAVAICFSSGVCDYSPSLSPDWYRSGDFFVWGVLVTGWVQAYESSPSLRFPVTSGGLAHQHGQYTPCQSFDKGFVEFFKKFMGVVVKYYKRLIYGRETVFWLAGMSSLYMGWWGYGGVQGWGSRPCLKPRHVILEVSKGETPRASLN